MKLLIYCITLTFTFLISCGSNNANHADYETFKNEPAEQPYSDNEEALPYEEYESSTPVDDGLVSSSITTNGTVSLKDNNKSISNKNIKTSDINVNKYKTKIIKNADLKIKVKDVKKTSTKIANLVDMNGGYISNENLSSDKNYYQLIESTNEYETKEYEIVTSNIIYIRIPSKNFQKMISAMKGLALSEDYMRVNAQDVTEEFYDLETRLKTKKEVEARYIAILKAKAKTLEEILIAEDKIRRIREEIEVVEGRLKYLKNKVNLSTIQVEVYQDSYYEQITTRYQKIESTGWSFGEKASKSISNGWNGVLWFIIGLLNLWPFILIGGVVIFILKRKFKKS